MEDITTDDVQRLFNGMTGAKATVEDGLITKSPLRSTRIKITGKAAAVVDRAYST